MRPLPLAASHGLQPQRHTRLRTQPKWYCPTRPIRRNPDRRRRAFDTGDGQNRPPGRRGVVAKRGGTTVYATRVGDADAGGGDFLPMSIDYQERTPHRPTSGAYNKLTAAPDEVILTCR